MNFELALQSVSYRPILFSKGYDEFHNFSELRSQSSCVPIIAQLYVISRSSIKAVCYSIPIIAQRERDAHLQQRNWIIHSFNGQNIL